jgi:hypothetical protein
MEHIGWVLRFGADDRQCVAFAPDGRTLMTSGGGAVLWPVPVVPEQDHAQLTTMVTTLAGLDVDAEGSLRRLSPEEWSRLLHNREGEPGSSRSPLAWHDRIAAQCEQFGPHRAALWHLNCLVAAGSDDWSLFARRARIYRLLADPAKSSADDLRAIALATPERLRAWHAQELQDRATAAEAKSDWPESLACLDRLVGMIGDNAGLHLRRGETHARLGHWSAAAADLDSAFRTLPSFALDFGRHFQRRLAADNASPDRFGPERLILYHLRGGDRNGYRAACASLLKWTPADADPGLQILLVHLLTLGPDGITNPAEVVRLAERAIGALSSGEAMLAQRYLGSALYRAGRYAEAFCRLQARCYGEGRGGGPWDWAFLAMTQSRMGHAAEARVALDRLRAFRPGAGSDHFHEALELEQLRDEAEAVVLLDPLFPIEPFAK